MDPKGLLLFSGPIETKEDLDKVPAEVRQRVEKLQDQDLPGVISPDDEDNDDADMNEDDNEEPPVAAAVLGGKEKHGRLSKSPRNDFRAMRGLDSGVAGAVFSRVFSSLRVRTRASTHL